MKDDRRNDAGRPLDGIVVLDLTQALSGPICTCVLADYGAKVIKVEAPNKADMTRAKNYDVTLPIDPDTGGDNFYAINRNKYGICVDNRSEKGKKILRDLASKVDVLVSNYRPGVTKKIGIDYETLREINPRLICCEISAFREKDRVNDPAFDVVVQAASGILASTGYPDAPPAKVGASITDISAGINAVQGILLALLERDKTGRGQLVTVKMQDAAMFLMAQYVTPCVADPTFDLKRSGMCHVEATPSNGYETSDGYLLTTPATDGLFAKFCDALEIPEIAKDERFCSGAARYKNRIALHILTKIYLNSIIKQYCGRKEYRNLYRFCMSRCIVSACAAPVSAHCEAATRGSVHGARCRTCTIKTSEKRGKDGKQKRRI